jgi:hypothetical protein
MIKLAVKLKLGNSGNTAGHYLSNKKLLILIGYRRKANAY